MYMYIEYMCTCTVYMYITYCTYNVQDWYTLLEFSLEVNQLQAAMWIYIKMNNFKISLDSKVRVYHMSITWLSHDIFFRFAVQLTLKLLKMLVDNDSYQPAKNILRVFLSSSIELRQFTHVCEIFQKNGFSEHLYMICASMIDNKLPVILHVHVHVVTYTVYTCTCTCIHSGPSFTLSLFSPFTPLSPLRFPFIVSIGYYIII